MPGIDRSWFDVEMSQQGLYGTVGSRRALIDGFNPILDGAELIVDHIEACGYDAVFHFENGQPIIAHANVGSTSSGDMT
jgi:hypothetical protein